MTYEELIGLLREYFNRTDAWRFNKFDKTQFSCEKLDHNRDFELYEILRKAILTDKDKELIAQAEKLTVCNYWDGDKLKAQCDTTAAWNTIDHIMIRLYHKEEAQSEME